MAEQKRVPVESVTPHTVPPLEDCVALCVTREYIDGRCRILRFYFNEGGQWLFGGAPIPEDGFKVGEALCTDNGLQTIVSIEFLGPHPDQ